VPPGGFRKLASLRIGGEDYTIDHFRELLRADWFGRLRALDFCDSGDQTLSALLKHPVAKELYRLQFHNSALGKNALRALARPNMFPQLIALDLRGCVGGWRGKKSATPEEVRAFLSTLNLPRLQVLILSKWPLDDDSAKALAANTGLPSLKFLTLNGCRITEEGKKALADSPMGRAVIKY
jgi:hypothetical protein